MHSTFRTIGSIFLVTACALAATTSRAVSPPPDGGYPSQNTAEGEDALFSLTSGTDNTALGFHALHDNSSGLFNTATGSNALASNTNSDTNTANGADALKGNTEGNANTAMGASALATNTIGQWNTATGAFALSKNTVAPANTAIGYLALTENTVGVSNTAVGYFALSGNITGSHNIALGDSAGSAITTGSYNIDIGTDGGAKAEGNRIRIGTARNQTNCFIAGISGVTVAGGVGVIVDTKGHLGTVVSSKRFKSEIKPMDKASEAILSLQPVTFHYKKELDPVGIPQFGLVAEQVEKVNPDLVARDEQGKPYTVRYEAVNAMLLNEFLKEHKRVQEHEAAMADVKSTAAKQGTIITDLKSVVAQQQKEIQALTQALKEQATQIQKVSDELRNQTPAPRVVADN